MSRCYPFPPPGYVRKECLIESIKGAKDEVKKDRKHKKKDKKRKERDNEASQSKKHSHKRRRKDENKVDDHCKVLINSEVELLEKSCLTVELELQSSSQTSCDSTLHSNEKPKQSQSQPLDGRHNDSETSVGNRLSDKGKKEVVITSKDQKRCQRLDASQATPRKDASREIETKLSKEKKPIPLKDNSKEKMPSCTNLEQEKPSSSHQETVGPSKKRLCRKCPPSMAVQFLNLIENWTPDRFERKLTNTEDKECWLFMNFGTKRHQVCNQNTVHGSSSSSTLWPTARYLPEAEVHALPFTVPF
ncbi:hypothetical protein V5N11_032285 [Cardamine amara subsp. amara]|uniref:Uncharacterized protein n=1 Tax=Cardamine amara subsp. amara TaxID=228776 RepID=A0ABD0ZB81_CARAN